MQRKLPGSFVSKLGSRRYSVLEYDHPGILGWSRAWWTGRTTTSASPSNLNSSLAF